MPRIAILLFLFLNVFSSNAQVDSLKQVQVWNVEVSEEAKSWKKTKSIKYLESARWEVDQSPVPAIRIISGKAMKRLLQDKRLLITISGPEGTAPLVFNLKEITRSVIKQIGSYELTKLEGRRQEILDKVKNAVAKELPGAFNEEDWKEYFSPQKSTDILSSFDSYMQSQENGWNTGPKDSLKNASIIKRIRSYAEKNLQELEEEKPARINSRGKIVNRKYKMPSENWYLNISDLVKNSSSWSPSDIKVSLQRSRKTFMYVSFDTIWVGVLTEMPLADSALCSTDLIGNDIRESSDPKKFIPCGQVAGFDCYGRYSPPFWEKKEFKVSFGKNLTEEEIPGSLDPAYKYLKSEKLELKKVTINAFASLEGETEKNLDLARRRSEVMVKVLQSYQKDSIEADIKVGENWKDFIKDLPKTPFSSWKGKDSLEIKSLVNDTANSRILEPWLKDHRYANLELFGQRAMTEKEKKEKIIREYEGYVNNLRVMSGNKKVIWEQKIASMRNWVIKEYLAGKMQRIDAEIFFGEMTPTLRIVNFYQQFRVLQAHNEILGSSIEQWYLDTYNAAMINHGLLKVDFAVNSNPAKEKQMLQNLDFLQQFMKIMINSIENGKAPASLFDRITLPESTEFIPLNVLFAFGKNRLSLMNKSGDTLVVFTEIKLKDSENYTKEWSLSYCDHYSLYCKEHLYYEDLKNAILKPGKMSQGNADLMKKISWIFLEVQLSETNEWAGEPYDKELPVSKITEMFEKLSIPNMCRLQKDKIMLEVNRKSALTLFYKEDKYKISKALSNMMNYYVRQKVYLSPELVEKIARMIIWFDKEGYPSKENFRMAKIFLIKIGVGSDQRFESLVPLLDRLSKYCERSKVMNK